MFNTIIDLFIYFTTPQPPQKKKDLKKLELCKKNSFLSVNRVDCGIKK